MVHGYLALAVCLLGSMSNTLNILVLTKREMINSTHTILTGLAIADLLVLLEYSSFATMYITNAYQSKSYGHAMYILFHAHFSQVGPFLAFLVTFPAKVATYFYHFYFFSGQNWRLKEAFLVKFAELAFSVLVSHNV